MEQGTTAVAYVGLVISVLTTIVGVVNHKRIRSSCCGKVAEASIEIDNVSPTDKKKVAFRLPEAVVDGKASDDSKSIPPV